MKKFASFVLALAMAAVCAAPAMADNQITQSTSQSSDTTVTFTITPAYMVTIPGTVTLVENNNNTPVTYESDLTLTASSVRLNQGKKLQVAIADGNSFQLSAGNAKLPYTITVNNNSTNVGAGSVVANFTSQTANQSATLHIQANDPQYAGEYTGTLKFTIAVVDAT